MLQQDLIVRDAADCGGSEDASDVGGRVDTGVEHLTNNCEADTQDDTDDQAGGKVERHVRRARSLRQGGLLHDGQRHRGLVLGDGVHRGRNLLAQAVRHGVGELLGKRGILGFGGDIDHEGAVRVARGDQLGSFGDRGIKAKIVDDRLEYGFGLHQLRVGGDLRIDVGADGAVLGGVGVVADRALTDMASSSAVASYFFGARNV